MDLRKIRPQGASCNCRFVGFHPVGKDARGRRDDSKSDHRVARGPDFSDGRDKIIAAFWTTRSDWFTKGIGVGADADYLYLAASWYRNAHSGFWKIWIGTGLIGLVLWGFLLIGLMYRAWHSAERTFFLLCLPPIIGFFYTLGPLNSNMLWVVFGLALGACPAKSVAPSSSAVPGGLPVAPPRDAASTGRSARVHRHIVRDATGRPSTTRGAGLEQED